MFRRFILYICSCLYLLTASQALGAGLTIPAGSALNVNACSLSVEGDVVCGGTIQTTTGSISLTGNWTLSSGAFESGTGTVNFNATSGTQVLIMGGVSNEFYNLTHSGAGTVSLSTNNIDINNNFINSAGTFVTNNLNLNVGKDWNNTATFTPGTNTVTLDGTNQTVYGATTFYNLTKDVSTVAADTISFHDSVSSPSGQVTTNFLTLKGATGKILSIRSTVDGTQAKMRLQAGAAQLIDYVDVKDGDASGGPTLVARHPSYDVLTPSDRGNNTNWEFGAPTITWDGSVSTDWDNAFNWDLGLVPAPGDKVVITSGMPFDPTLSTDVIIGQLTLNAGAVLTLNGKNLTVAFTGAVTGSGNGSLTNSGNIKLQGTETVTLDSNVFPNTGTFTYVGDGNGSSNTRNIVLTVGGSPSRTFNNLTINDPNATKDIFQTNGSLTLTGNLTVTSGSLDTSTNANDVSVTGNVTVDGGTWTATNSGVVNVDGSVTISSGTLTAPSSIGNTAFTIAGNFTRSGGTFTHSSGKVTLDGTGQSISGTIIFSSLRKVIAAADTLTIANTSDISVVTNLVLTGASGQLLSLRSDVNGSAYDLRLLSGGIQTLDYLDVKDADACNSGTSSGTPPVCSGTGVLLVARHSPDHSDFAAWNNDHWVFGGTTITWTGNGDDTLCAAQASLNLSYDCQNNWDLGVVPIDEDTAIIPAVADQPKLDTNSSVKNLTLSAAGSTLTLNAKNYTIVETLSNAGTIKLIGSETVSIGTTDIDSGTFEYLGDADGDTDSYDILTNLTVTTPADNKYNNLVINSTDGASDTFSAAGANLYVEGGFTLTAGVFVAPATAFSFTVEDDFTRSGGTFTHSSGRVTFDGGVDGEADGSTQTIYGSTTFYRLTRTTATAAIFKFDNTGTQTVVNNLTLAGASGQLLSLRSDVDGSAYDLILLAGGTQSISYMDVKDADACLGGTSSGSSPPVCSSSTGITLVGRYSTDSGNNDHWRFGAVTVVWTGTTSTDWDAVTPTNWDLGLVPIDIDSIIIPNVANDPIMLVNTAMVNLTMQADAVLNTSTFNLTVTETLTNAGTISFNGGTWTMGSVGLGTFSNTGTVSLSGAETIDFVNTGTALPDVDSGLFIYRGNADGVADTRIIKDFSSSIADYFNLTINDPNATPDTFRTAANLNVAGTLTVTAGTIDTSIGANSLTSAGILVNGGTLTATNGTIDLNGDVTISSGTFTAPSATTASAFTISGSFAHSGGTFTHSNGRVTFDTTNPATISGNTTFYKLYATTNTTGPKQITFEAGSTTTVANTFNFSGYENNRITLRSTTAGTEWFINAATSQYAAQLDVQDSNANNASITCLNCQDSGNNTNWIFQLLSFIAPNSPTGIAPNIKTINLNPVMIGSAPPGAVVVVRLLVSVGAANPLAVNPSETDPIVATVTADAGGKFFVILGADDASLSQAMTTVLTAGEGIYLRPFIALTDVGGDTSRNLIAELASVPEKVPRIIAPGDDQRVSGPKPTIQGIAKQGQAVSVYAKDRAGALLTQEVGSGTVNNTSGTAYDTFSVTLTTALTKGINYLAVVVDGIASLRKRISLTDPFGVVFDSSSNKLINNATVAIYRKSDNQLAEKSICANPLDPLEITTVKDIDCNDTNPFITGGDGFYFFLTASADYYIRVSATGYAYPSTLTEFPAGRTIVTGSKAEDFTVGTTVIEMDHPVDANGFLLRIEKDANKSQVRIGDVITYTIQIQNLSSDNVVENFIIDDRIPPGFKYLPNRVLLDGLPLPEPANTRPMLFNIGSIDQGATRVLKYQLVVGSGVLPGKYENVAVARYTTGVVISNRATKAVMVVPDPLFDLGTVIGKVFYDWNENGIQDAPEFDAVEGETVIEKPVPNVQIVTEDGTVITTDREGKYNLPGLLPGRHILRVDERSLPPGSFLTTDKAVVVDIAAGALSKVNFGVNMDNEQVVGADAQFFNEKIQFTQVQDKPALRLNAAMYHPSAHAPALDEMVVYETIPVRQVEFRLFTNYAPFIEKWHLDIIDADTKKLVRRFEGNRFNIHDPIFFNGRDSDERVLRADRHYAYVLTVKDAQGQADSTKETPFKIRELKTEAEFAKEKEDDKDKDKLAALAEHYRKWLESQLQVNTLKVQRMPIEGETVRINRQGVDIRAVRIMKDGNLFAEVPVSQADSLTPGRLLAQGPNAQVLPDNLEVVLPKGDYTLEVVSPQSIGDASAQEADVSAGSLQGGVAGASVTGASSSGVSTAPAGTLNRFTRNIKVGDDYFMFVAMGDAKVGYNFNQGNIEPVQTNDRYQEGFWSEGKAAYYLKGKIKGKYLVTSSFDTQREQKELFRKLDPDTYYPIYGDQSSINYDATNTKGPLYLLVEWDKSSVIWGNYAVDFTGNEFAAFSRNYYGGKIDYQSVATNPYGDARTKVAVFHAEVQERPAHNEFLGTGGSLYFLKHKKIVAGSDKIKLEVRDQVTGLVISSKEMKNGADYELDDAEGRILFWQPVAMIAKDLSIVAEDLLDGNPIYVVADYQYAVKDIIKESSEGARVVQAIGDNLVIGGTAVKETQATADSSLKGTDALLHLGPDATIKADYAESDSQGSGTFVSTDGGITFNELSVGNLETGKAYGLTGDARLFSRLGINAYYKWVENTFNSPATTSQQGKQTSGMALTFDVTPVTRLTARQDIQKLIQNGNLQTTAQVGASETTTTLVQIIHEAERLKLTGAYQIKEVKDKIDGIESSTNEVGKTLAGKAEYALTGKVNVSVGQQFDINDPNKAITTIGADAQVTDRLLVRAQEAFSPEGNTTTVGATTKLSDKLSVSTDYGIAQKRSGAVEKTATVGAEGKLSDNISTTASVAVTESSAGGKNTATTLGAKGRVADGVELDAVVGVIGDDKGQQRKTTSISSTAQVDKDSSIKTTFAVNGDEAGAQTKSIALDANRKVDEKTESSSSVKVDEDAIGGKTTTVLFTDKKKLNDELQAVSERSFGFNPDGSTASDSKYGVLREKDGRKAEASLTRKSDHNATQVTQSNIFGLSGDINDKVALNSSFEQGRVQNLDGTGTDRTAIAVGSGYVLKDTETAVERLKNSTKIEFRFDRGQDNKRQFVFYNALEGKITDNLSAFAKLEYSKTENTSTAQVEQRHKEIILGAAYRPVNVDNLNLIARYTYKEGQGPAGQANADIGIEKTRMQVFAGEAIYDIDENWQLAEKFALRINEEKTADFEFNKTHTWLMIHRINYKVDRNWTIGSEYRRLTQVEAKDSKTGFLLEATRNINDNTQLGIGWNFTQFSDDLTNLSYTSQGPFLRMTGKLYDRTPEEKARARAKWLDERINQWAWVLVRKELSKQDSLIVEELNRMFILGKEAQAAGRLEESRQIYKDVVTAGQMMFDEASEYIRGKIAVEEKLQEYNKTAQEYFKGGEYIKARKIWEKVVEDASKGMLK